MKPVSAGESTVPWRGSCWMAAICVQTKIASGGTSTVYRGLDTRLDRPVALKVMDSRYAGDQQFLTRFQARGAHGGPAVKNPGWSRSTTRAWTASIRSW